MNLNLRYDRLRSVHNVIATSTVDRPRRGKTLLEKQKMIFRDALNHDNMYQKSVAAFKRAAQGMGNDCQGYAGPRNEKNG